MLIKVWPISFKYISLVWGRVTENRTIINWGRWSEIVKVKLTEIASREIILGNILPISVSESEVSQVGCKIFGTKELETTKSPSRKTDFCSLDTLSRRSFR